MMKHCFKPLKTRFDFVYPTSPSAPPHRRRRRSISSHFTIYDVALSDIRMPLMDGYRLLSRIQHLKPAMPVLLMSGHLDEKRDSDATQMGAFAILHKPLDRELLISQLQLAFQRTQR